MKREINAELVDVWATMMYERIDKIREKQCSTDDMDKYRELDAYISGIAESLAMLSCLEDGRFTKDYERICSTIKQDFYLRFGGDYTTDNKLKVFLITRKADWCEDDAIVVLAIDKLHAERCARCNSSYFSKGEVKVKEIKMDEEKVVLISNMGA